MTSAFDAVIIGSGTAGTALAVDFAEAGRKTALVEKGHVGGTCLNVGCTPTKTLLASARIAHLIRRAGDFGIFSNPVKVDFEAVQRRQQEIVRRFRGEVENRIEETEGLTLFRGAALFEAPDTLCVQMTGGSDKILKANQIFIDTGTRARRPPIEGLTGCGFLDNAGILDLKMLPRHLLIVGGGYIGVEFAQMYRRLGSDVTLLNACEHLLCQEDPDVAEALKDRLAEEGIEFRMNAEVIRAERDGGGIHLVARTPSGDLNVRGTHLLLAAGRVPNTQSLDLEKAGVATTGEGYIRVDEKLRTTAEGIYALGDVKGGPAFTHVAYDDYRIVRGNLLEGKSLSTAGRPVPFILFTDPPFSRVGHSERTAREEGLSPQTYRLPMKRVARAVECDETAGFMKALVERGTDRILGCSILGLESGEVMSMIQIAMMGGLSRRDLRDGIFAYPGIADSLNSLFSSPVD